MESKARVLTDEESCKEQQEMAAGLVKGNGVQANNIIGKFFNIPYSAKRWRRKTLANQQNIALAKKTLANQLGRSSGNLGRLMQAAGQQ